jgi:hypothetical protein
MADAAASEPPVCTCSLVAMAGLLVFGRQVEAE